MKGFHPPGTILVILSCQTVISISIGPLWVSVWQQQLCVVCVDPSP